MTDDSRAPDVVDEQVMLIVRIAVKAGAQAEMSSALERLVHATRRQDRGMVRFEVGLDPADDTRVIGYEIWESQDALGEHAAKDHTKNVLASARDLVVDPTEPLHVERWRPTGHESPAAAGRDPRQR